MIVSSHNPLWTTIICLIGLGLGLLSGIIVMISLIKLPFKDVSTELRKYSTLCDLLFCIAFGSLFFPTDHQQLCVWNYLDSLTFTLHGYWVFYMSYITRKIIYLKQDHDKSKIKFTYCIFLLASAIISGTIFTTHDLCLFPANIDSFFYATFTIVLQEIIILISIVVFYRHIRKALIIEITNCDDHSKYRKIFFVRIYGYSLIFLIISIHSFLILVKLLFSDSTEVIDAIRLIILSYYPLLNSLFYGLMQSSRRVLRYLISKDFNYPKEEEILNDLRAQKFIPPRTINDFTDESESKIFNHC